MKNDIRFLTIGSRLSKQLLSAHQYGYNYLKKGTSDLETAFADCYYFSFDEPVGYKVQEASVESLDMLNGPDFVVGVEDNEGDIEKAEIAFLYDDLDVHDDLTGEKSRIYQARIVFDERLSPERAGLSSEVLRNTVKLLIMKDNLNAIIEDSQPKMILGIHSDIKKNYPILSSTIVDLGFKEDLRTVDQDQFIRYHKGTSFNSID